MGIINVGWVSRSPPTTNPLDESRIAFCPCNCQGSWAMPTSNTTLTVYAHLINTDDHTGNMAALRGLAAPKPSYTGNVVTLHG
jgi:hypothetical protein